MTRPPRRMAPVPAWLVVLALAAAIGMAWQTSGLIGRERAFGEAAQRVQAHVASLLSRSASGDASVPVFRFTGAGGSVIDITALVEAGSESWQVGQPVALLYNPTVPPYVEIDSLRRRWGAAAGLAAITIGFFAAALLGLRSRGWRLFAQR